MVRKQSSIADSRFLKLIGPDDLDEREAKVVIDRTANDVDQVKRSSSRDPVNAFVWTFILKRFCREPIATRPSKMALSTGSFHKP